MNRCTTNGCTSEKIRSGQDLHLFGKTGHIGMNLAKKLASDALALQQFRTPQLGIAINETWLSLFSLPGNLTNVLRRGDAGAGAPGHRARDRLSISAAHQFAP